MAASCREILLVEDGQPFVEEQLKGILPSAYQVKGRLSGDLPRTGELNPDNVRLALGMSVTQVYAPAKQVVSRPPALCNGCGHRDVYDALNKVVAEYPNAKILEILAVIHWELFLLSVHWLVVSIWEPL